MTDIALQIFGFVTSGIIAWRVEAILNIMAKNCIFPVRLSFWSLVVGALGLIVTILQGYVPSVVVLLLTSGIAMLLLVERRIASLLRLHSPTVPNRRTPL